MNAASMHGVHERTPKEQKLKEDAIARGENRAFFSLVKSRTPDEWHLLPEEFLNANQEFIYSTATANAILAWFNFPGGKLRQFLDCLLVLAEHGPKSFTATNLDIGKQWAVGRGAKSDSLQKRISRYKSKFIEWQSQLGYDLVGIERGRFDSVNQKNDPTTYTIYMLEWIPEILAMAKAGKDWNKNYLLRLREIKRQTFEYLQSKPDGPALRGYEPKTLSEGQKFDRTDKMLDSMLKQQLDRLHHEEIDPSVYIKYRKNKENHIITNPIGTVGNILTPESDIPANFNSVWHMIKTGEIVEVLETNEQKLEEKLDRLEAVEYDHLSYAVEVVKEEQRDVKTPRVWDKGSWVETANDFTPQTAETPTGHFEDKNGENDENRHAKSFEINGHDGTFSGISEETILDKNQIGSEPDFTDWFAEAADVPDSLPITEESLQNLFDGWVLKVRELVPDKSPTELWKGSWQVYLDLEFMLEKQLEAYKRMETARADILAGKSEINDLREVFADWIASGAQYYQNGVTVPQSAQKLRTFRERMLPHLRIEDG